MLKKLIKHEWRSVWKVPGAVNLFLLLYTLMGTLSFHSSIWESDNKIIESLLLLASIFYIISIIVISFTVMIYLTVRFYRNIYTDEGYLMHTLPVSQRSLVFSKLLVAFLWIVITGIVILISIFSVVVTLLTVQENISFSEIWDVLTMIFNKEYAAHFKQTFGIGTLHGFLLALTMAITNILQGILMIYASISVGQMFQKHKVLGSFLGYIVIHTVLQILNSVLLAPAMFSMRFDSTMADVTNVLLPYYYFMLGESIILCIVFFFMTEYFMKKKLNLD
ncbi:MAG: hypothetical protein K2K54_02915 [Lachnospiraceae bacterium]|nr:hypothetical protein [Lachnospiraceae bacterium]